MRPLFFAILILCSAGLFAAPLEGGFARESGVSARDKVITEAVKYENTPYRFGGLTSGGMDCSGFRYASFKDALGVEPPRTSTGLYSWTERVPLDSAQPGDLLFFKTDGSGRISHVAIYLGDRLFIHSASSGPKTGVIYSTLDDRYWGRAYAGAGRVLPQAPTDYHSTPAGKNSADKPANAEIQVSANSGWNSPDLPPAKETSPATGNGRFLAGAAIAPTWAGFLKGSDLFRGVAGQLYIEADTSSFNKRMIFGLQLRPEYDGALGVFRLPITLAWGPSEKIMIFAGPVFSFGDAAISTDDGERKYSGGTSWLGAIGLTAAPFTFKTSSGSFSPYLEAAWQYYISDNETRNANADFSAGFRFSTGVKWALEIK
jgi:probable lipoprotein NlpC